MATAKTTTLTFRMDPGLKEALRMAPERDCPLGQCNCPFLIMCMVSIPASSFLALQKDLNPSVCVDHNQRCSISTLT